MRNVTANPTTASLLAAALVLAAALGIAELRPPAHPPADGPAGATHTRVERTSAICPQPVQGLSGTTTYTAFTPSGDSGSAGTPAATGAGSGKAVLTDVAGVAQPSTPPSGKPAGTASPKASGKPPAKAPGKGAGAPRAALRKTGTPVSAKAPTGDAAPAVAAVTDAHGRGLSGLTCGASGTGFWFAGASTAAGREDYVNLTNDEDQSAIVDLVLYGAKGEIDDGTAGSLTVPPGSSVPVLLSTLTRTPEPDLVVNVVARTGRVGAALHASDGAKGSDWLPASATPDGTAVIPGLPGDLTAARLVVLAPGDDDADLKVQLSGPNGWFTPAGHETLHVKSGMVSAVDLGALTRGTAAALRLSPTDPKHSTPVVAGLRVDRGKGTRTDAAWLAGSAPVGDRATSAENWRGGSTLILTSTGAAAKVRVTSSAGSGGGTPAVKEVQLPAGGTVSLAAPEPPGVKGSWAVTVETLSGGPVAAARV
uniref:DUF5719 family protein n=1 Tax=Peterkaempfera griseoplana TaxID=66896 RepID=UPI000AD07B72